MPCMDNAHTPPFVYYGAKRRFANRILARLGNLERYIEPFAGSLAVLLSRAEPFPFEIAMDTHGLICNFWRALTADPEATARHSLYPTIHQDLTARHRWLVAWAEQNKARLVEDPDYFDAKAAGWWCWGMSHWIGGGFCAGRPGDQIPKVDASNGGEGVSMQRRKFPDTIPHVDSKNCGQGVSMQRRTCSRESVPEWFRTLAKRLDKVVVLNRDWKSATSGTILGNTRTHSTLTGLFLDPPYKIVRKDGSSRKDTLYQSDADGENPAVEAYDWAVEHGSEYRIAYACHEGDFPVPEGWDAETETLGGRRGDRVMDQVMYSPTCLEAEGEAGKGLERFF